MKWNKAVNMIQTGLALDLDVSVEYHVKWNKNSSHIDRVDSMVPYEWEGQMRWAINTNFDQLNEGSYIIDDIMIMDKERKDD